MAPGATPYHSLTYQSLVGERGYRIPKANLFRYSLLTPRKLSLCEISRALVDSEAKFRAGRSDLLTAVEALDTLFKGSRCLFGTYTSDLRRFLHPGISHIATWSLWA